MIIAQFCRGRFMPNQLVATDGPNGLAQSVNPQVCLENGDKLGIKWFILLQFSTSIYMQVNRVEPYIGKYNTKIV